MAYEDAHAQASLLVEGDVPNPVTLDGTAVAALPRTTVRTALPDQPEATFEGVAIHELLKAAGKDFASSHQGERMMSYLIVEADGGYRALFALSELDPDFTDRRVILAYGRDGQPLSEGEGPFRVVVEGEKRGARWVRKVTRLEVGTAS